MIRIPLPVCWEPERIPQAVWLAARLGEESAITFWPHTAQSKTLSLKKASSTFPGTGSPTRKTFTRA